MTKTLIDWSEDQKSALSQIEAWRKKRSKQTLTMGGYAGTMNNPILRLATAFREGREVPYWDDPKGRLFIRPAAQLDRFVKPGVQFICGYNRTRFDINAQYRKREGYECTIPCPGERVICLKNNRKFGIFNGQQFMVHSVHSDEGDELVDMHVQTDDRQMIHVMARSEQFGRELLKDRTDDALFDFGYCITGHKGQGSEWGKVVALEEISPKWNAARWRYTVVTRAKEKLAYCM